MGSFNKYKYNKQFLNKKQREQFILEENKMKRFNKYYEQFFNKKQRELFDKGIYDASFISGIVCEKPLAADATATTKKLYNQKTIDINTIYEDCIFNNCEFNHNDLKVNDISRFCNCIFINCSITFNRVMPELDNCLFFNCCFWFNRLCISLFGKVGFFYSEFSNNKFDIDFNNFIQNIKGEHNRFKTCLDSINTNDFVFNCTTFVHYPLVCVNNDILNVDVDVVKLLDQRAEKFKQEHEEFWAATHPHVAPSSGEFYGYKALYNKFRTGLVIAKLLIPESARRVNGFGVKCRAEAAIVKDMWDFKTGEEVTEGRSLYDDSFKYYKDEIVQPDGEFDDRDFLDCGSGIHFFMTQREAEEYGKYYTGFCKEED